MGRKLSRQRAATRVKFHILGEGRSRREDWKCLLGSDCGTLSVMLEKFRSDPVEM